MKYFHFGLFMDTHNSVTRIDRPSDRLSSDPPDLERNHCRLIMRLLTETAPTQSGVSQKCRKFGQNKESSCHILRYKDLRLCMIRTERYLRDLNWKASACSILIRVRCMAQACSGVNRGPGGDPSTKNRLTL